MGKLRITQVDDKNFFIDDTRKQSNTHGLFSARAEVNNQGGGDELFMSHDSRQFSSFGFHYEDLEVVLRDSEDVLTFSSAREAMLSLNSFIGNFKRGGGSSSPTFKPVRELPETGMPNIIYVVPRNPNDPSKGSVEWMWDEENRGWEEIGDTNIDISNFAKLQSDTTQVIDSDLALKNGKKLLVEKEDGTQAAAVSVGNYVGYKVVNFEDIKIGDNLRGAIVKFDTSKTPKFIYNSNVLTYRLLFNNDTSQAFVGRLYPIMDYTIITFVFRQTPDYSSEIDAFDGAKWLMEEFLMPDNMDYIVTSNTFIDGIAPDSEWQATNLSFSVRAPMKQAEIGSEAVRLNLNSIDRPTLKTVEGTENIAYLSDISEFATEDYVNSGLNTKLNKSPNDNKIYAQKNGEIIELLKAQYDIILTSQVDGVKTIFELGEEVGFIYDLFLNGIRYNKEDYEINGTTLTLAIGYIPENGDKLVLSHVGDKKPDSWIVLIDDTIIRFGLENTPFSSFSINETRVLINGKNIDRAKIKQLAFGNSYKNESHIGDYFVYFYEYMDSINLNTLKNIASIGSYFLYGSANLPTLDLSKFNNVTTIGSNFLRSCTGLTSIQIGNVDWSSKTISANRALEGVPNISTSILYADSQELADKFKAKMNNKISNWTVIIN